MARGHQKFQSQQKNAQKQEKLKKAQGGPDQKAAAQKALVFTCTVCKVCSLEWNSCILELKLWATLLIISKGTCKPNKWCIQCILIYIYTYFFHGNLRFYRSFACNYGHTALLHNYVTERQKRSWNKTANCLVDLFLITGKQRNFSVMLCRQRNRHNCD